MSLQVPDECRYEIKFVGRLSERYRLQGWLRNNQAGFRTSFPDRQVNNIYFDDYDYQAYGQNLSGASQRVKLRYRWYGESVTPDRGDLELKCKRNFFGWKLRQPVTSAPYAEGDGWSAIRRKLMAQATAEGREWLGTHPCPMLLNRYSREYYVSADERIRATIDSGLAVYDQRYKPKPNFNRRTNLAPIFIVEFKFARDDRERANRVLQTIPIRVSRHSKYMTGVTAIANTHP